MPVHSAQAFPSIRIWGIAAAAIVALGLWLLLPGGPAPAWPGSGDASLPPSLKVDGHVTPTVENGSVVRLDVPLALRGNDPIRLTQGGGIHAVTYMSETASQAVPATYTVTWLDGNADEFLDPGEHAVLRADLPAGSLLATGNPARLVIKPVDSMPLSIEDVLP